MITLSDLTLVDYTFLLIIIVSTLMSLIRGFVREALSLATWGFAVWATFAFSEKVSMYLSLYISNDALCMGVSIVGLFLLTLAIGMTVSYILTKLMAKSNLSGTDRLVGVIFGAGRGVILVDISNVRWCFNTNCTNTRLGNISINATITTTSQMGNP